MPPLFVHSAGNLTEIPKQVSEVSPDTTKPTHRSLVSGTEIMCFVHILPGGASRAGHRAPRRNVFSF
eukprot:8436313-Pyramimonas_sp.AAC.1